MTSAPLPSGLTAAAAAVPHVEMAPPSATWVASRETMQKYQAENKAAIELEDGLRARMMKMSDLELERLAEHAKIHHLFAKYRLHVKNEFGVETMNELPPFGDGDLFEELIGWHVWLHANAPNDALQTTRPPALRKTIRSEATAPTAVKSAAPVIASAPVMPKAVMEAPLVPVTPATPGTAAAAPVPSPPMTFVVPPESQNRCPYCQADLNLGTCSCFNISLPYKPAAPATAVTVGTAMQSPQQPLDSSEDELRAKFRQMTLTELAEAIQNAKSHPSFETFRRGEEVKKGSFGQTDPIEELTYFYLNVKWEQPAAQRAAAAQSLAVAPPSAAPVIAATPPQIPAVAPPSAAPVIAPEIPAMPPQIPAVAPPSAAPVIAPEIPAMPPQSPAAVAPPSPAPAMAAATPPQTPAVAPPSAAAAMAAATPPQTPAVAPPSAAAAMAAATLPQIPAAAPPSAVPAMAAAPLPQIPAVAPPGAAPAMAAATPPQIHAVAPPTAAPAVTPPVIATVPVIAVPPQAPTVAAPVPSAPEVVATPAETPPPEPRVAPVSAAPAPEPSAAPLTEATDRAKPSPMIVPTPHTMFFSTDAGGNKVPWTAPTPAAAMPAAPSPPVEAAAVPQDSQLVLAIKALGVNCTSDEEAHAFLKQLHEAKALATKHVEAPAAPVEPATPATQVQPAAPATAPPVTPASVPPSTPSPTTPAASVAPPPTTAVALMGDQANSASHPREYASFKRWCEQNPGELQKAWQKGGQAKLAAFRKYVIAAGNGSAVEAVMRFSTVNETEDRDGGSYVEYEEVLSFFKQDAIKAQDFVARRRSELHGTGMGKKLHVSHCGLILCWDLVYTDIFMYWSKYIENIFI